MNEDKKTRIRSVLIGYADARWKNLFADRQEFSRRSALVVWISFLIFLWVPLAVQLTGIADRFGLDENRKPAPPPQFDLADPRRSAGEFERWYADRFGLRAFFVTGNNWILARVLSSSPNTEVQIGRDGWFFFTADKSTENFRGLAPFTQAEIDGIVRRIDDQARRMKLRGITYVVLVCPNKQSIYPEYLPSWVTPTGPTRLDQVSGVLSGRPDSVFLDPRSVLLEAKKQHPVYMKTDSHWNAWGALAAHARLMEFLRARAPELREVRAQDYVVTAVKGGGSGDLTGILLGLPGVFGDDWVSIKRSDGRAQTPSSGKVVVFHDSFILNWQPLLEASFAKVVLQHRGLRGLDDELVDREKPDVVIYEVVERNLDVFLHPVLR